MYIYSLWDYTVIPPRNKSVFRSGIFYLIRESSVLFQEQVIAILKQIEAVRSVPELPSARHQQCHVLQVVCQVPRDECIVNGPDEGTRE
jgi:hypothetical protein